MAITDYKAACRPILKAIFWDAETTAFLTLTDVTAAVEAIDAAFDAAITAGQVGVKLETALNQALPEPVKSACSPAQKSIILAYAVMARYGIT